MKLKFFLSVIFVASSLHNAFVCAADQNRIFINWYLCDSGEVRHRRKPVLMEQGAQVSMVKDEAVRDLHNNVPRSDMRVYKGKSFRRFDGSKILADDRVVENGEEFWIWSGKTLDQFMAHARARGILPSKGEKEEGSCLLS